MANTANTSKKRSAAGRESGEPVDFNTAAHFVEKIKEHYNNNPESYHRFLDIMQAYQRENKPIQAVHEEVRVLFSDSPELQADFEKFLPVQAEENRDTAEAA